MVTSPWKTSLLNRDELVQHETENGRKFRTGLSTIPASSIAQQFYCEMKVEQDFIHGEIETEATNYGTELHEKLLSMEKTTIQKIIEGIESGGFTIVSMLLAAKFDELVLVGIPDAIIFQDSKPTHVIELKTTAKGDVNRIYDNQKAQALVYGLLLEQMGFDCSKLSPAVVRYRSSSPLSEKEKSRFLSSLAVNLSIGKSEMISAKSNGQIVPHLLNYSRQEAAFMLNQKKGYWLNQREPEPTMFRNRCGSCVHNAVCPSSLLRTR